MSCLKKHNMRSSLKTRLQDTRFWKTFGIFLRATFRPSRGSVTDLWAKTHSTLLFLYFLTRRPKNKKMGGSQCSLGCKRAQGHNGLLKAWEMAALTIQHQRLRNRSACRAPFQPGRAPRWPDCCEAEAPLLLRLCSLPKPTDVEGSRLTD